MEEIQEKANYCLNCKVKPCSLKGCPLNNNIPDFIKKIKEEKVKRKTGNHCSNVFSKACNSEKSGIEWWHEP